MSMGLGPSRTQHGMSRLSRSRAYVDSRRPYIIYIDGQRGGTINEGEYFERSLPEGIHDLYLRIGWCRSQRVSFTVARSRTTQLLCKPANSAFTVLYGITIGCRRYISLELVEEPPTLSATGASHNGGA